VEGIQSLFFIVLYSFDEKTEQELGRGILNADLFCKKPQTACQIRKISVNTVSQKTVRHQKTTANIFSMLAIATMLPSGDNLMDKT
jgi:hypothetical protein